MKNDQLTALKNLISHIRQTKGNISTKVFSDNKIPFELFLRLSQLSCDKILDYANKLEQRLNERYPS